MKLFSRQLLSWFVFLSLTTFSILLSTYIYQSWQMSQLAYRNHSSIIYKPSQILGVGDEQNFESAAVKRVLDGDTVELFDGRKVRYIGVDTPETNHPDKDQQCYAREATEKNKQLVAGKTVKLQKDVSETDRYGRLLRYVWVDDQLINLVMVKEGYAFARSYPPDITKQSEFKNAEREAKALSKGLWSNCDY